MTLFAALSPATAALVLAVAQTTAARIPLDAQQQPRIAADTKWAAGKMNSDMRVKPSGDADADFVAMMIPIATAPTRRSNSLTPSQLPIPPTTNCLV
jgi:uncharacterized protein (DUF305 family)